MSSLLSKEEIVHARRGRYHVQHRLFKTGDDPLTLHISHMPVHYLSSKSVQGLKDTTNKNNETKRPESKIVQPLVQIAWDGTSYVCQMFTASYHCILRPSCHQKRVEHEGHLINFPDPREWKPWLAEYLWPTCRAFSQAVGLIIPWPCQEAQFWERNCPPRQMPQRFEWQSSPTKRLTNCMHMTTKGESPVGLKLHQQWTTIFFETWETKNRTSMMGPAKTL